MAQHLSSRVERRFQEIEERLRGHGVQHPEKLVISNYVDEKVDKYLFYLKKAYREAPCSGCKKLVFSSILGARIYQKMEKENLKREDFSDAQIEKLKKEVETELSQLS